MINKGKSNSAAKLSEYLVVSYTQSFKLISIYVNNPGESDSSGLFYLSIFFGYNQKDHELHHQGRL